MQFLSCDVSSSVLALKVLRILWVAQNTQYIMIRPCHQVRGLSHSSQEVENNEKLPPQKVVAVAYETWSHIKVRLKY